MQKADTYTHKDSIIISLTFISMFFCFYLDSFASSCASETPKMMGLCAWFVFSILVGIESSKVIRLQVVISIIVACIGEHFASLYLHAYTYRCMDIPWYVPPGKF